MEIVCELGTLIVAGIIIISTAGFAGFLCGAILALGKRDQREDDHDNFG